MDALNMRYIVEFNNFLIFCKQKHATVFVLNSLYWASYMKYNLNFVMELFKHSSEYTHTIESNNLCLVKIVVETAK
jgi:hypothetical protein